jgi:partner of Y14 and mago protein
MSKPPLFPDKSASGIAIDPRTLDRVVPESRRADGSVRKERKIRPGFTPQEDVARFRSVRQQAVDSRALPKGHIPGWVPPGAPAPEKKEVQSKSAKKNEKRKEKRKEKREEVVRENWESEDDEDVIATPTGKAAEAVSAQAVDGAPSAPEQHAQNDPHEKAASKIASPDSGVDAVADKLDKLSV